MIRIEEHHTSAELELLEQPWSALAERSPAASVFQSYDWVASWYESFAEQRSELVILSAWQGERLVGVVPCTRSRIPRSPFAGLYLLGRGATLTEHFDALVAPECEQETAAALSAYLATHRRRWDLLLLSGVPAASAFAAALVAEPSLSARAQAAVQMTRELPESWELFYRSLSKSMKENANNYVNRLRREGHSEQMTVANSPAELTRDLAIFYRLHAARAAAGALPRHRDRFASPAARQFLDQAAARLHARERVWLTVLRVDEQPVAAQIWLLHRETAARYYSGFDPDWSRNGVMTVLTRRGIEKAIAEGYRRLDLLLSLGDPKEKARWGATPQPVQQLAVGNPRLRSRAALAAYARLMPTATTASVAANGVACAS